MSPQREQEEEGGNEVGAVEKPGFIYEDTRRLYGRELFLYAATEEASGA